MRDCDERLAQKIGTTNAHREHHEECLDGDEECGVDVGQAKVARQTEQHGVERESNREPRPEQQRLRCRVMGTGEGGETVAKGFALR